MHFPKSGTLGENKQVLNSCSKWWSEPAWPVKSRQMSTKVAQKWFHLKNERFGLFYKNCLKCWQFGQNNCWHRLWKVAQRAKNRPIWSHWSISMMQPCTSRSVGFLLAGAVSIFELTTSPFHEIPSTARAHFLNLIKLAAALIQTSTYWWQLGLF